MFCCELLNVHSGFAIILTGKGGGLVALLGLPFWCLVVVVWLFLAVPWICLRFVVVVFPDHPHLLYLFLNLVVKMKICRSQNVLNAVNHDSSDGMPILKYSLLRSRVLILVGV